MFGWLKRNNTKSVRSRTITLEEQLQALRDIGIALNPGVTVDTLLQHTGREKYEADPYDWLLLEMGCELERDGVFENISDHVWYIDTEVVEDHGVYVDVFQRLQLMSGIEIGEIEDYVDIMEEVVWVSFTFKGERLKWEIEVDDDWMDLNVLAKLSGLIERELGKRLVFTDSHGQSILILCLDDGQLRALNRLVKYPFYSFG
ncbi:hypothetical protein FHS18_004006 [Paenibacillus phyllosphaerae]|uniref:Uncharacterized protein n=1 Tax=Paenibacillus phyllosphaerae TaxID=274593 RepID=A0A7W5B070_9BACL|nr:hypothetical protein [Paenibacillus phyllosphaerae]MBB3111938.1 hypothetical protein [Paenibacillus phyllosphaerae]